MQEQGKTDDLSSHLEVPTNPGLDGILGLPVPELTDPDLDPDRIRVGLIHVHRQRLTADPPSLDLTAGLVSRAAGHACLELTEGLQRRHPHLIERRAVDLSGLLPPPVGSL